MSAVPGSGERIREALDAQQMRARAEKAKRTPDLEWAHDLVYGLADDVLALLAAAEEEARSLRERATRAEVALAELAQTARHVLSCDMLEGAPCRLHLNRLRDALADLAKGESAPEAAGGEHEQGLEAQSSEERSTCAEVAEGRVTPRREAPMRLDGDAEPPAGIPADGEEGAVEAAGAAGREAEVATAPEASPSGCTCGWPELDCAIRAWGSKPDENLHLECAERDADLRASERSSLGAPHHGGKSRGLRRAAVPAAGRERDVKYGQGLPPAGGWKRDMFAAAPLRGCKCPICMVARAVKRLAAQPGGQERGQ